MSTPKVTRVWTFQIPATDGTDWHFEFHCTFEKVDDNRVCLTWQDRALGYGETYIQDSDVTWTTLFMGWQHCAQWASAWAQKWNLEDADKSRCR